MVDLWSIAPPDRCQKCVNVCECVRMCALLRVCVCVCLNKGCRRRNQAAFQSSGDISRSQLPLVSPVCLPELPSVCWGSSQTLSEFPAAGGLRTYPLTTCGAPRPE